MPYHIIHYPVRESDGIAPPQIHLADARIVASRPTLKDARTWADEAGPSLCKPGDRLEAVRVMDEWGAETGPVRLRRAERPKDEAEPEAQA